MTSTTAQGYARIAGCLAVLSALCGGFGEIYVPSALVGESAATTFRNLGMSEVLYRASFAIYLVEALCDVGLMFLFYVLLKPVHRQWAQISILFGLMSTAIFAVGELFYFSASLMLPSHSGFVSWTLDQRQEFVQLAMTFYGLAGTAFMVFYGVAMAIRGVLIFRSGYLPKWLGVLLIAGGSGFVLRNYVLVLAPRYDSPAYMVPMMLSMISLAVWLTTRGIDPNAWNSIGSRGER